MVIESGSAHRGREPWLRNPHDGRDLADEDVLRLLAAFGIPHGPGNSCRSLLDAARYIEYKNRKKFTGNHTKGLISDLTDLVDEIVDGVQDDDRCPVLFSRSQTGTGAESSFAARGLAEAAVLILSERNALIEHQKRKEWVQLGSALNNSSTTIRIGGYQAHYERFLGKLAIELRSSFPWLNVVLSIVPNRSRETIRPEGKPSLREMYENGDIDYWLAPLDGEKHPHTTGVACYQYGLRVVEQQRKGAANPRTVPVSYLAGKRVISSPAGHSTRTRILGLLADNEVRTAELIPEESPLLVHLRAMAGEGVGILSDEYRSTQEHDFPLLEKAPSKPYKVQMNLVARPSAPNPGARQAVLFAAEELALRDSPGDS